MNHEEALIQAIISEPTVPLHCFAYADLLAERGELKSSRAFRWMGVSGRRPFHRLRYGNGHAIPAKWGWAWYRVYSGWKNPDPYPTHECRLPRWLFAAISSSDHRFYETWHEAVTDLAEALAKVHHSMKGYE